MEAVLIGSAGFILYFLYDINSVTRKNKVVQKFFALGSVLVTGSAVLEMKEFWKMGRQYFPITVLFAVGGLLFLSLLIYTLFFALPFDETYCKENQMRLAYTEGVYSLCRHPGVLWFAGLYLCMWGMTGNRQGMLYYLGMILWNVLYVVMQDLWIFPLTFSNYHEYRRGTPFLIPNGKSICRCLRWAKDWKLR